MFTGFPNFRGYMKGTVNGYKPRKAPMMLRPANTCRCRMEIMISPAPYSLNYKACNGVFILKRHRTIKADYKTSVNCIVSFAPLADFNACAFPHTYIVTRYFLIFSSFGAWNVGPCTFPSFLSRLLARLYYPTNS